MRSDRSELYEHPVDLFVGQFIGSPSMNVLEATVVGTPGRPGPAHR